MTAYRVGAAGATVFDEEGVALHTLRPGLVVVEGTLNTPGSLADQHRKAKQRRGYADKMIRPAEDKAR
jgi:hypothetical protein